MEGEWNDFLGLIQNIFNVIRPWNQTDSLGLHFDFVASLGQLPGGIAEILQDRTAQELHCLAWGQQ